MLAAILALRLFLMHSRHAGNHTTLKEPVSILKPLYRDNPHLESCLRTFCTLDYPVYQIIFGIQDPNDPARAVAERLRDQFPQRDIQVVVTPKSIGLNPKINNLAGMLPAARHPWLVISDSDIRVNSDYLSRVALPLADRDLGLVTCLYGGLAGAGRWSQLGSLFINDWFVPSVCMAWALRSRAFAFGATLALRRETLDRIGGFEILANTLADDYRLSERIRRLGLKVQLSPANVETVVTEGTFSTLWRHELRWLRTIRFVNPLGFSFAWITLGLPCILLGTLLSGGPPIAWWGFLVASIFRLVLHYQSAHVLDVKPGPIWLVPLRDFLTLGVWLTSFMSRHVVWHERKLHVHAGDLLDEHPGELR